MASTYSPNLRLELPGAGEQAGTWGTTTNRNLGTLIEGAISGRSVVSVTSASQALTALEGADDQARDAILTLSTTTTANFAVYAPPASKLYVVQNTTAYTATIYNSTVIGNTTAAGAGVAIPAGKTMAVMSDGTNMVVQNSHHIGTVVGNVTGNVTGELTGNASTATALQTARTIGGVSFDGTDDIDLPGVNAPGDQDTTGTAQNVVGTVAIANGGTGATTAAEALVALGADNADNLTEGTVGTARLASGVASSATYLRGDQTWAAIPDVGIGVGQAWQSVSRSGATWYQNTTGKPIAVSIQWETGGNALLRIGVSTSVYVTLDQNDGDSGEWKHLTAVIPVDHWYYAPSGSFRQFMELR